MLRGMCAPAMYFSYVSMCCDMLPYLSVLKTGALLLCAERLLQLIV